MEASSALLALAVGYLAGSISFARVIAAIVAPGRGLEQTVLAVPDSEVRLESNAVSATTARLHLGTRYGCLAGLLDMAKAGLPALAFKLWLPETPTYLLAAGAATVGHIWPVYHRFRGGRGLSPVVGGMLVMDWVGTLLTSLATLPLFAAMKNRLGMAGVGMALMIPWTIIVRRDPSRVAYVVAMNLVFWAAMIPDLRELRRLKRAGTLDEFEQAQRLWLIGAKGEKRMEVATLPALRARIAARLRRKPA
jgi:glycerol-3-phosphate acyltransferase PlsY